jgi:hypothetical protein
VLASENKRATTVLFALTRNWARRASIRANDMKLTSRSRIHAALFGLVCMLLTQLALALCAGHGIERRHADQSTTKQIHASAQQAAACQEKQLPPPDTCSHVQVNSQSLDKTELPRVQPFVRIALVVVVDDVVTVPSPPLRRPEVPLLGRASGPPLCIRQCSFQL